MILDQKNVHADKRYPNPANLFSLGALSYPMQQ